MLHVGNHVSTQVQNSVKLQDKVLSIPASIVKGLR